MFESSRGHGRRSRETGMADPDAPRPDRSPESASGREEPPLGCHGVANAVANGGRDPYRVCGAASRLARARARDADLTPSEWKVLSVVEDLTVSYSGLSESVTAARIAAAAGLDRTDAKHLKTRRALRRLAAA